MINKSILYLLSFVLLSSCTFNSGVKTTDLEHQLAIQDFTVLDNYKVFSERINGIMAKPIELDYSDAINGFTIPTQNQTSSGYFTFSFTLENTSNTDKSFFYKLYYQNETYKYPEIDGAGNKHPFAQENFYGSWQDSSLGFKKTALIQAGSKVLIQDSFKIIGNPRFESKYYKKGINDRYKRNPRVGNYQFMLAVSGNLDEIPIQQQNIFLREKDSTFENPFYFFQHKVKLKQTAVVFAPIALKVVAKPDLSVGVYIDIDSIEQKHSEQCTHFQSTCGKTPKMQKSAAFKQYFHYVNQEMQLRNIPIIRDIFEDDYSLEDYNYHKNFFTERELYQPQLQDSKLPCEHTFYSEKDKAILLRNPASTEKEAKKENIGIITRHAFTYGKYRVKAKMPELINRHGFWNGLTNAIWLLNQELETWNNRRTCNKDGYMATYWGGENDKRVPKVSYSEIDFEILKTTAYCPDESFPPIYGKAKRDYKNKAGWNKSLPPKLEKEKDKIVVACTNWDMACHEPEKFGVGCHDIWYNNKPISLHRWSPNYRAVTSKSLEFDDELFRSEYYYFEIDWRPDELIWRIGPSPDKMRVVGYMNNSVTMIPNNQMVLLITQEFHNTKWWPGTPFQQQDVPFLKNPAIGKIYELVIE